MQACIKHRQIKERRLLRLKLKVKKETLMKIFYRVSLILLAVSSTAFSSADKVEKKPSCDDYASSVTDSDYSENSDSESLDEDGFGGIFFENLTTSFHSEEVSGLRKFYLEYVEGFDEEYKNTMKKMAASIGLDVSGIAGLNFDMLLAIDNDNWLKSINLLQSFPEKLILENQKRILEYDEEIKHYDSTKFQSLLSNLTESNFDELPPVIRDLIEFSKSKLDSDHSKAYISYLKATWIVTQKSKLKQEELEKFTEIFEIDGLS